MEIVKVLVKAILYGLPCSFAFIYIFGVFPGQITGAVPMFHPIFTVLGISSVIFILWWLNEKLKEADMVAKEKAEK